MFVTSTGEIHLDDLVERLRALLGPQGLIEHEAELGRYNVSIDGMFRGRARYVARPSSTAEVAAVVDACRTARIPIVPQGGNTGWPAAPSRSTHAA